MPQSKQRPIITSDWNDIKLVPAHIAVYNKDNEMVGDTTAEKAQNRAHQFSLIFNIIKKDGSADKHRTKTGRESFSDMLLDLYEEMALQGDWYFQVTYTDTFTQARAIKEANNRSGLTLYSRRMRAINSALIK